MTMPRENREGGEKFCLSHHPYRLQIPCRHHGDPVDISGGARCREALPIRGSPLTMSPSPTPDGRSSNNGDGDQWTVVQSKRGKSRRQRVPDHQNFATPANPSPQLDVQGIAQDHERLTASWRTSTSCEKLRGAISASLETHTTLTKAVCLAVGSFDPVPELHLQKSAAHIQLAAFRTIVDTLGSHDPI